MGFTKLDERILQSSIMAEDPKTFKVWIALLAACRENGIAYVSTTYLQAICHMTELAVDRAIEKLASPDPASRSIADEGRRIRKVDGGFEIINYAVYRDISLKDAEAERKRLYRHRIKECPDNVPSRPDASASASVSASASGKGKGKGGENLIIAAIAYLNEKAGKKFRPSNKVAAAMIGARLAEGFTLDDLKKVIDTKTAKWKGDPKMDDYLRPSTLFRPSHFEEYLNEAVPGRPRRLGERDPEREAFTNAKRAQEKLLEEKYGKELEAAWAAKDVRKQDEIGGKIHSEMETWAKEYRAVQVAEGAAHEPI